MRHKSWTVLRVFLTLVAALSIAAPAVMAQTSSATAQAGAVVQKSAVTDPATGNLVITEETRVNGQLVKMEITEFYQGQLVKKIEETFANTQMVHREVVTVSGDSIIKVDQTFENEVEVARDIKINHNGAETVQKFELRDGAWVKVDEQHRILNQTEHGAETDVEHGVEHQGDHH